MKSVIAVLLLCASMAFATEVAMNMAGGAYNFGYNTADGQSRAESGSAGNVAGSYSYIDANGDRRTVHYNAGPQGFQATGDVGVDRRTAAAAAAMAALAPKAPPAIAPIAAPIAPIAVPWAYWGAPTIYMNVHPGLSSYSAKW